MLLTFAMNHHPVKLNISISPKKVTQILLGIVLFFAIAGSLAEYFALKDFPFGSSKWFYDTFDLDGEFNPPALYSGFSLLFCAGLLKIIAMVKKEQSDRFSADWKILSYIFLYLSLDEILSLHELLIIPDLREFLNLPPIFHNTWVIPGIIVVAFFVYKYLKFLKHLTEPTRQLFILSGFVYITGALGMEMMGGFADYFYNNTALPSIILVIEEILEMLGIVVFIYTLLSYLSKTAKTLDIAVNFKAIAQNKNK
ncbi:MAG: hypothetical protein ACOC0N_04595 [Chroococcales cyanobacterium]